MLFMCPSRNGQVFLIKEKYRWVDGQREMIDPGYIVKFKPDRLPAPHTYDQAMRTFSFRGGGTQRDMMTPLDPIYDEGRLSFFDTEWVPQEKRKQVEEGLLNHPGYGTEWVLVENEKVDPPWPNYDELTTSQGHNIKWVVEQIVSRVEQNGYDPIVVHNYERLNLAREEVLEALIKLGKPKEETVEVAA